MTHSTVYTIKLVLKRHSMWWRYAIPPTCSSDSCAWGHQLNNSSLKWYPSRCLPCICTVKKTTQHTIVLFSNRLPWLVVDDPLQGKHLSMLSIMPCGYLNSRPYMVSQCYIVSFIIYLFVTCIVMFVAEIIITWYHCA